MRDRFLEILERYWGYPSFRPMQLEAIESICSGRDTVVVLPTGGGKSMLYQIPALSMEGIAVVITPLISLMKDQVDSLRRKGVIARFIHAGMSRSQIDNILDSCVYGNVKLLYISPERLASSDFRLRLAKMKVSLVAVDEAHCIAQWGHDFRPSYLEIVNIRKMLADVPFLALTASATKAVEQEIISSLKLEDPAIFRGSLSRSNITYVVRQTEDKNEQMLRVAHNVGGCGIVYVRTRKDCELLVEVLKEGGVSADYYHAGMPYESRNQRQEAWMCGKVRVMVATNAFGMGVNKADVRFVIHYDMCDSLESYYQEAGRAGRDGKRSYAVLLVGPDDRMRADKRLSLEFPPLDTVKKIYDKLCAHLQIPYEEGAMYPRVFSINEFSVRYGLFPPMVASAIRLLQYNGYLILTDEIERRSRAKIVVSRESLYKTRMQVESLDGILTALLRCYAGIFSGYVSIDERHLAAVSGYTEQRVEELLKILQHMQIIHYRRRDRVPLLMLLTNRVRLEELYIAPDTYLRRIDAAKARLDWMRDYAFSQDCCREQIIQRYFGEEKTKPCGHCDVCRSDKLDYSEEVLALLGGEQMDVKDVVRGVRGNAERVTATIKKLLEDGEIVALKDGKIAKKR